MATISRRFLIRSASAATLAASTPGLARAAAPGAKRFLLVILRGGVDGLAVLPPIGDPDLARHRPDATKALHLGGRRDFGLHPDLTALAGLWRRKQLVAFHAIGTPYRDRSHFDAQNVLESGLPEPRGSADGWLNRAVLAAQLPEAVAMNIGPRPSLVLSGQAQVGSWSPNGLPPADDSTLARIADLWSADRLLGPYLERAIDQQAMTGSMDSPMDGARAEGRSIVPLMTGAAELMSKPDGPRIVALDNAGWDTHVRMDAALGRKLGDLNRGLEVLIEGLQPVWNETAVLVVSEFGRTAAINGNQGTDHGNGGAAFLFGGAVQGGHVIADWPGLGPRDLLDARDLRPTLDVRQLFRAVLHDHLAFASAPLGQTILPGVRPSRAFEGLFRT
ncbi:MAG: DUF1501 domain-containing protein [Minwuia sp.]|uniref:DUF1501 domain-containing protein n=1 Tax=Minwuia sp. TaxID=2493630 RepID=UPI003A845439